MNRSFPSLIIFTIWIAQGAFAVPRPASQKPEELAYQLAKYYSIAGEKPIICEKKKGEAPVEGEADDYGNFTLKGERDLLFFTGNPGAKTTFVELTVNDVLTATFLTPTVGKRYVATIDAAGPLFEKRTVDGSLLKMEGGLVIHSAKLQCRLK